MPKPWLKLWASSLDSEKIQSLSGDQTKTWIKLLMIALRFDRDGELPPLASIAFQARISVEQAAKDLEEQLELGMLEKRRSLYVIHDWKHWQGEGLSDAERKARQRAMSRDMSRDMNGDGHGTESIDVQSNVTNPRVRGIELDKDIETRQEEKTRQDKEPRRGKAAAPPFVLPDWIPLDDWNDHREVRKRKRGAMTPRADRQIVAMLERVRDAGHDPITQLRRSSLKGWVEVFVPDSALPTKQQQANFMPSPERIAEMNAKLPKELLESDV